MDKRPIYATAREAFHDWRQLSVAERLTFLRAFRRTLADQGEQIAELLQKTTGKLPFEALTAEIFTVLTTISYLEHVAAQQLKPRAVRTPVLFWGRRSWVEYHPVGVVLVIAPWNYPLQLTLIPALSALLAGNAVIIKPSEVTTELDAHFRRLFDQAGFPEGLVQIVSGDGEVGASLVKGEPDLIFFTGSVATGQKIQMEAARSLVPTILELGGKDPLIILEDAPLERAVQGALWGSYTNCGQVCLGTERIYVQREIYPIFLERFLQEARLLKVGSMTSWQQVEQVRAQVEDALAKGARLALGSPPQDWVHDSLELKPMVLTDVNEEMAIAHQETFGPVVTITPFTSDDEVIRLANATPYGLGASVWSKDLDRARELAEQLVVGNISINDTMITVANPHLPFGGLKKSGLGSYHGAEGLRAFCTQRAVMESKGRVNSELNWFPYTPEKEALLQALIKNVYGSERSWWRIVPKALNPRLWRQKT
jgi:acyl-CoA reductase-like NAD-dependent aldehyde dehydrogenase